MKVNKGIIVQKTGKKTTIFDGEKSVLYTFNATASFIFGRIKKGQEASEIIEAVIQKYNVEKDVARRDYKNLVTELQRKKIVS